MKWLIPGSANTRWPSGWPAFAVVLILAHLAASYFLSGSQSVAASSQIAYLILILLAGVLSIWNAVHSRPARSFWILLSAAFLCWATGQSMWVYHVLLRPSDAVNITSGTLPFFLRVVLILAALAARPDLKHFERRRFRRTLDLLAILIVWVFLYAYVQLPNRNTILELRVYSVLYAAENVALAAVLAVLFFRASGPWKVVYGHLLGASVTYIAGTVGLYNLASKGSFRTNLTPAPLLGIAAICWFVWVGILGHRLRERLEIELRPPPPESNALFLLSRMTLLTIPIVGLWELGRVSEPNQNRVLRLAVVLCTIALLVIVASVREYFARRTLLSDVGVANECLNLALQSANAVAWDWDFRIQRGLWSGDLKTLFGISATTYVADEDDFYRHVSELDRGKVRQALERARQNREPFAAEFRVVRSDNTIRWASSAGRYQYAADGSLDRMLGVAVDITDLRLAEHVAEESEDRFRLVADSAPVMVWMSGTDKLCNYFNRGWLEFTGRPVELELGNRWAEGVHPDDLQRCLETYTQAFDRHEKFQMEYRLRRHDLAYRWVFDVGVPRFISDGSFAGYIGSCIDISDSRDAEAERIKMLEQVAHLDRVASMGQMAASLAHELAQPLAAILSNAQAALRFAKQSQPDLDEVRAALSDIAEDNQRARAFVQNMRTMFQRRPLTRVPVDLNKVVDDVSRIVKSEVQRMGIQLEFARSTDQVVVLADEILLQQVVLNLVKNGMDAAQAVTSGPRIVTLTTARPQSSRYGTLTVEDNGCGIAEEIKRKLFTPFLTTKKDGLGMGLSICRSLLESLDGRIGLVDCPGPGAAFLVELPLATQSVHTEISRMSSSDEFSSPVEK